MSTSLARCSLAPAIAVSKNAAHETPAPANAAPEIHASTIPTVAADALDLRNDLLLEHLPEVHRIARKIHQKLPTHVILDDLIHAGVLGLIDAAQKFSAGRNVEFKHYAKFRIRGAILDSLREGDWGPRALRKQARAIHQARFECKSELRREPEESEVAAKLGMKLSAFQQLASKLHGLELAVLPPQSEERYSNPEAASAESPFSEYLKVEILQHLGAAMNALPPRESRVLVLCDFEERTMKEVGKILGVGESRVSQIRTEAVSHLRDQLRGVIERPAVGTAPGPCAAAARVVTSEN